MGKLTANDIEFPIHSLPNAQLNYKLPVLINYTVATTNFSMKSLHFSW